MPTRHVGQPAGGVEPRARRRSPGRTRVARARVASGGGEQRRDAGLRAAGANARQSLRDQRAVDAIEAHDVGDGAQRDEVEQRREVAAPARRRSGRVGAARARSASST